MDLAGVMWWSMDLDNFRDGYPLISTSAQRIFTSAPYEINLKVMKCKYVDMPTNESDYQPLDIKAFHRDFSIEICGIKESSLRIINVTKDDESPQIYHVSIQLVPPNKKSTSEFLQTLKNLCGKTGKEYTIQQINSNLCLEKEQNSNTKTTQIISYLILFYLLIIH